MALLIYKMASTLLFNLVTVDEGFQIHPAAYSGLIAHSNQRHKTRFIIVTRRNAPSLGVYVYLLCRGMKPSCIPACNTLPRATPPLPSWHSSLFHLLIVFILSGVAK